MRCRETRFLAINPEQGLGRACVIEQCTETGDIGCEEGAASNGGGDHGDDSGHASTSPVRTVSVSEPGMIATPSRCEGAVPSN